MKYAAKVDTDNIIDDDDDQRVVGNAATETNVVQEVKSGEDPMEKIKSFGKKIKGKFQKSK
jgi:rRNA maturation endonuclease Nob1